MTVVRLIALIAVLLECDVGVELELKVLELSAEDRVVR
jgi:hypothetical protein